MMKVKKKLNWLLKPAHEAPKPKVYQSDGRRMALRLEPPFIRALEQLADDCGARPSEVLMELQTGYQGKNFSSYIRTICMLYMEQQQASGSNRLSLDSYYSFLDNAPTPALVLNDDQTVIHANEAFTLWAGVNEDLDIINTPINQFFELQIQKPLRQIMEDLTNEHTISGRNFVEFPLLFKQATPALAARARVVHYLNPNNDKSFFLVWLRTGAAQRPPRVLSLRKPPKAGE